MERHKMKRQFNASRTATTDAAVQTILDGQYPELRDMVGPIAKTICEAINKAAGGVDSKMPYKAQWLLEEVIKELQSRV